LHVANLPRIAVQEVPALGWLELVRRAQESTILGQLIDHAPSGVAQAAVKTVDQLLKVAACMHRGFSEAPALTRLRWVERFSQFDGPADFHDLSRLPDWAKLSYTLRQRLSAEAAWLFEQVDTAETGAVSLINALIRVALLLAGHAPVDRLIRGTIATPVRPEIGGRLRLNVDLARIRVGMHVVVPHAKGNVRGIVEDIGDGVVSAKVVAMPTNAGIELTAVHQAHFEMPAFFGK
jgi:hypothetical protein